MKLMCWILSLVLLTQAVTSPLWADTASQPKKRSQLGSDDSIWQTLCESGPGSQLNRGEMRIRLGKEEVYCRIRYFFELIRKHPKSTYLQSYAYMVANDIAAIGAKSNEEYNEIIYMMMASYAEDYRNRLAIDYILAALPASVDEEIKRYNNMLFYADWASDTIWYAMLLFTLGRSALYAGSQNGPAALHKHFEQNAWALFPSQTTRGLRGYMQNLKTGILMSGQETLHLGGAMVISTVGAFAENAYKYSYRIRKLDAKKLVRAVQYNAMCSAHSETIKMTAELDKGWYQRQTSEKPAVLEARLKNLEGRFYHLANHHRSTFDHVSSELLKVKVQKELKSEWDSLLQFTKGCDEVSLVILKQQLSTLHRLVYQKTGLKDPDPQLAQYEEAMKLRKDDEKREEPEDMTKVEYQVGPDSQCQGDVKSCIRAYLNPKLLKLSENDEYLLISDIVGKIFLKIPIGQVWSKRIFENYRDYTDAILTIQQHWKNYPERAWRLASRLQARWESKYGDAFVRSRFELMEAGAKWGFVVGTAMMAATEATSLKAPLRFATSAKKYGKTLAIYFRLFKGALYPAAGLAAGTYGTAAAHWAISRLYDADIPSAPASILEFDTGAVDMKREFEVAMAELKNRAILAGASSVAANVLLAASGAMRAAKHWTIRLGIWGTVSAGAFFAGDLAFGDLANLLTISDITGDLATAQRNVEKTLKVEGFQRERALQVFVDKSVLLVHFYNKPLFEAQEKFRQQLMDAEKEHGKDTVPYRIAVSKARDELMKERLFRLQGQRYSGSERNVWMDIAQGEANQAESIIYVFKSIFGSTKPTPPDFTNLDPARTTARCHADYTKHLVLKQAIHEMGMSYDLLEKLNDLPQVKKDLERFREASVDQLQAEAQRHAQMMAGQLRTGERCNQSQVLGLQTQLYLQSLKNPSAQWAADDFGSIIFKNEVLLDAYLGLFKTAN